MADKKNYIDIDGNGNIILQDINGNDININDTKAIKHIFETTTPEYITDLYAQIDVNYKFLIQKNKAQTETIIALLKEQADKRGIEISKSKNILTGTISGVGGNVNIGDKTIINKTNLLPVYIVLSFVLILVLFLLFKNDILKLNQQADRQQAIKNTIVDTSAIKGQIINPVKKELPDKKVETSTKKQTEQRKSNIVKPQKLTLKITTNKGSKPIFKKDEKVIIKYKLNKPAYVRIIYLMADSSAVLLADNLYVDADKLNKYIQTPYNFVCAEPFGTEKLVAYAQAMPFEKLNTTIQYGYEFITQSIYSAYQASEKGLKKDIEFSKIELTVITKSKNN